MCIRHKNVSRCSECSLEKKHSFAVMSLLSNPLPTEQLLSQKARIQLRQRCDDVAGNRSLHSELAAYTMAIPHFSSFSLTYRSFPSSAAVACNPVPHPFLRHLVSLVTQMYFFRVQRQMSTSQAASGSLDCRHFHISQRPGM